MSALALARAIKDLADGERAFFIDKAVPDFATLKRNWRFWARPEQQPPEGDWRTWLILAGRGFGKTRTGAEWVRAAAEADGERGVALVGGAGNDARAGVGGGGSGRGAGRGRGGG